MPTPFRVLIIDDSEKDARFIGRTLRKLWPTLALERVESAAAVRKALQEHTWDCVVCDMFIPGFGALAALEILKQSKLCLPFVVVSGVIGLGVAITQCLALLMGGEAGVESEPGRDSTFWFTALGRLKLD